LCLRAQTFGAQDLPHHAAGLLPLSIFAKRSLKAGNSARAQLK
jgi:hypothetical protein